MNTKDMKTIQFYKFAVAIEACKPLNSFNNIDIKKLLTSSYLFLIRNRVVTHKQKIDLNIFKDRYNHYLEYCIEKNLVQKDEFVKITHLNITSVPDMSKIKVPDIKEELQQMNIDLEQLSSVFAKMFNK